LEFDISFLLGVCFYFVGQPVPTSGPSLRPMNGIPGETQIRVPGGSLG
jgi:hypothetical protein